MLIDKLNNYNIILASGSPRRKQLLSEMGIKFQVRPGSVNENYPDDMAPQEIAEYLSSIKAEGFSEGELTDNTLIITADTIVTLNEKVLGKPVDRTDAIKILQQLSGKSHQVITGVTLKMLSKQKTFSVSTLVYFKELTEKEIVYYIDTFKPYDKAGAYGIQEWIGHAAIEKIEGSYFNVMGLPTHRLYEELLQFVH
jgi:septum formation protein